MRIHESQCGADSSETVQDLHQLAGSLEDAGDVDGAADQYERALKLKERVVGGDMEELADMQYSLAGMYIQWNNYTRARELLAESIGTFKRLKGPRLAVAYETLAYVEESLGRYPEALAELARASKVWESCGPGRTAERAENMKHRAGLLDQLRRRSEAAWLRERAEELTAPAGEEAQSAGCAS